MKQSGPHHGDATRPGEILFRNDAPFDAGLHFVGILDTPFRERADCPRRGDPDKGPDCKVVLHEAYVPALAQVEAFEWLELFYWLHQARRDLLVQSPKANGAHRGTFSLRSPLRPNPIGVSTVRLIRRLDDGLIVRGLDCLNGTPLIDIKPERCGYAVQAPPKRGL